MNNTRALKSEPHMNEAIKQNGTVIAPNELEDKKAFVPHVTVATIVEKDGKFLFVEEISGGRTVLNQPAGHLDPKESLIEAAARETYEETGWHVEITGLLGVSLYRSPNNGITYNRTTFTAKPIKQDLTAQLDEGIIRAVWLTLEEAKTFSAVPRSPLVLGSIEQYNQQAVLPLSAISAYI